MSARELHSSSSNLALRDVLTYKVNAEAQAQECGETNEHYSQIGFYHGHKCRPQTRKGTVSCTGGHSN